MDKSKQVSQSMGLSSIGPRVVVRSSWIKSRELEVLGLASMRLQKPHPDVASHASLSKIITHHFILPRHPVMLGSYISLVRSPDHQRKELSMAKHKQIDKGSS